MSHDLIITFTTTLKTFLEQYEALTIFISVFLTGENAAIAIFALSAQGLINPVHALVYAFLGSLASDVFWFFITEYVLRERYEKRLERATKDKSNRFFMHLIDKHFFWTLIFIKFLVGIRLILTIYIVIKNKIPFKTKVALDALGTIIFMGAIFPIGWYLGKGFSSALSFQENISYIITAIFSVLLVSHLVPVIIKKLINRFYKEN